MEPINRYSLENFTERHRADFDLHEPRPELWHALEQQLDADAATRPGPHHLHLAANEQPATPPVAASTAPLPAAAPVLRAQAARRTRWQPLSIVLGALALALALGLSRYHATPTSETPVSLAAGRATGSDAALYQTPEVLPASQGGTVGNARLDTAVHGMERYYAVQLAEREAQLTQLAPGNKAEWAQDLASLDSTYQQLRAELPQHPQPEVVLTAMNRNLQTRLDILDQQLAVRGDATVAQGAVLGGEYTLADSRSVADNLSPHAH